MYKLFTDKVEVFECNIKLSGASVNKSNVRLVVESADINLLFKGKIDSTGKCTVPVKRLSGLLGESTTGTLRLEVIADDTFFTPWESEYVVETSKKVTVEVKSQSKNRIVETKKPAIQIANIKQVNPARVLKESSHIVRILKMLIKENITLKNLPSKKNIVNRVIANYSKKYTITEAKQKRIIDGIVKVLHKRK
tara:strand:+ start:1014 stop:1595 length:582 start_codon:yes stop_codon:yes gene_type:complete